MIVDIVESVRLMQGHETSVIERWRRFVAEVRGQVLPAAGGRLVKSLGDGMLLEFDQVAPAIAAALDLQTRIEAYNDGLPADACIQLRIGAHVADVVVDELDVYGSGVNLAARLAGLAEPGAVVVSAAVRDELVDRLHARLQDLGNCFVKHLEAPIRAFAVHRADLERPTVAPAADLRPTLAVIPFECLPANPAVDAVGHAMADELIAAMSRHPSLRVLSRLSTAHFRGLPMNLANLQSLLGASYVVCGRYLCHADQIRLNVELVQVSDGRALWTGHGQATIADLFASNDELIPMLVAQIGNRVATEELLRARSLPLRTLHAYTLYLGATGLMNSLVPSDFERARAVFEHLAERNPRQASPYAMLSRWHVFRLVQGWSADRDHEGSKASDCARRALEVDPTHPVALTTQGLVLITFDGDLEGASERYRQAIAADPQEPYSWAMLSGVLSMTGAHAQARDAATRAISLSPLDPNLFLFETYAALAALGAGDYAQAVRHAYTSLRHNATHSPSHRILIAALWLDGRHEDARQAVSRCIAVDPQASMASFRRQRAAGFPRAVYAEQFARALRDAGMPG